MENSLPRYLKTGFGSQRFFEGEFQDLEQEILSLQWRMMDTIEAEQRDLFEVIMEAGKRQQEISDEQKERLYQSTISFNEKLETSKESGKAEDLYEAKIGVQRNVLENKNILKKNLDDLFKKVTTAFADYETKAQEERYQLQKQCEELIQCANVKMFDQAGSYITDDEHESATWVNSSLMELEEEAETHWRDMQKTQRAMVDAARKELRKLEVEGENFRKALYDEHIGIVNSEYLKTNKTIRKAEAKEEVVKLEKARKAMAIRIKIGREVAEKTKKIEDEQKEAARDDMSIIAESIKSQEEEREMFFSEEKEQVKLTEERQKVLELIKEENKQQREWEEEHEQLVRETQEKLKKILSQVDIEEEMLLKNQEELIKLEDKIDSIKEDNKENTNFIDKEKTLNDLIKMARLKEKELKKNAKSLVEEVMEEADEKMRISRENLEEKQERLFEKHRELVVDIQEKTKKIKIIFEKEKEIFFKEQENKMQKKYLAAESRRQNFRSEQEKIIEEAQKKLNAISNI